MHNDVDGPIPHARVYCMSSAELEELKIQLKDYLERGWIRPSTSEFASGVLFAIKPGTNKLRMCTDYRRLKTYTKKIGFALPNIDNILGKLGHSKCFTALDLQSGFHQLRIKITLMELETLEGRRYEDPTSKKRHFVPNMERLSTV
jgi:hypothetical protein